MTWKLSGTYFESCNCEAVCPCVFLSPPTTGECTAIAAWHIAEGEHGGERLDGLNVALAVHSPGHMAETPWQVALYLDDQANSVQTDALGTIFSGAAGGHPAVLASHIGEVLGVAPATMTFEGDDSSQSMRIGDVGEAKVTAMAGQGGAQVTITNHPLALAPGEDLVAARSDYLRYTDHGYEWDLSGVNGLFSPFAYEG